MRLTFRVEKTTKNCPNDKIFTFFIQFFFFRIFCRKFFPKNELSSRWINVQVQRVECTSPFSTTLFLSFASIFPVSKPGKCEFFPQDRDTLAPASVTRGSTKRLNAPGVHAFEARERETFFSLDSVGFIHA